MPLSLLSPPFSYGEFQAASVLERILKKLNIDSWIDNPEAAGSDDTVLLLRGDYLYDGRFDPKPDTETWNRFCS